jgi:hypothetical protein
LFFEDDPGIITDRLLLLLVELDIPTPPGVLCVSSLSGRPQKLSSSSATCLRASIFLMRHSFDKLRQLL